MYALHPSEVGFLQVKVRPNLNLGQDTKAREPDPKHLEQKHKTNHKYKYK